VKSGDIEALRANEASRWAANDIIKRGGPINQSVEFNRLKLDPAVKDRLVTD